MHRLPALPESVYPPAAPVTESPPVLQNVKTLDVGCPSAHGEYILLPLVKKEPALAYRRIEYSRNRERKKAGGEMLEHLR